jgi:hypothetical protein
MALHIVARKVEVAKANNGGILKYKAMTNIVEGMKPTLPWLTKDMLRSHIRKMKKDATRKLPGEDVTAATANSGGSDPSTLSSLTPETSVTLNAGDNGNAMTATEVPSEGNVGVDGRPKGSTAFSKRELKQREQFAKRDASKEYQEELKKKRKQDGSSTELKHGTLATIIAKAKGLYNVEDSIINPSTIRIRCKRNNINPVVSHGTTSPMAAVEPYLIAFILQLA